MPYPDLVLNICKPAGWTSFDLVRLVKRLTGGARSGHAGTLDPFAEGVLLVCTGKETKNIQHLVDCDKEYLAQIRLGIETDTLDITGRPVRRAPVAALTRERIEEAFTRFAGPLCQVPPRFSALKKNGKRWFELARQGVEDEPSPRTIFVHELELLAMTNEVLSIRIRCSKGTYVRSLARDLAIELGTVGYLSRLERTRIGAYSLASSIAVKNLNRHIETLKHLVD